MKRIKINKKFIIIVLILFISIGFAYLSASLNITGLATIKRSVWDVHFENIVNENENVLNIDTPAQITNNKLRVDFEVTLDQPGEEYSFYVDVLNNSTFDVALSNLSITGLDSSLEDYIIPTVTYSDGITPLPNDILKENSLETLRVSVKYNDDLDANNLPTIDSDFQLSVQLTYNQADNNSKERTHLEYVNRQTPGVISIGDEIAIGDEHFYVVSTNEEKTSLLAKYNLFVGEIYSNMTTKDRNIQPTEEGYGIQNSTAKGVNSELTSRIGTVAFSRLTYWLDEEIINSAYYDETNTPQVYDETYNASTGNNYSIAYHVINYNNYLKGLGLNTIKARLLSLQEMLDVGCTINSCSDVATNKQFIYSTSYWLQTLSTTESTKVYQILSSTKECRPFVHTYNYGVGVRPVIEVDTDYLLGNITVSFDPNGGEVTPNTKLVRLGTTYDTLPTPTKPGYTFVGWNGYNPVKELTIGSGLNANTGEKISKSTCATSDYIEVDFYKNAKYRVSGLTNKLWSFVAYYDENKTPLGRTAGSARTSVTLDNTYATSFNEGNNAKYIRITQYEIPNTTTDPITVISEANIMLNPGENAIPYEPYYITNNTTVVQNKSHTLKAIWEPGKFDLTIDPNGGTFNESYTVGTTVREIANRTSPLTLNPKLIYSMDNWRNIGGVMPTRSGYTLEGFYDNNGVKVYEANGYAVSDTIYFEGDTHGNNSKYIYPNNLTVIAHWTQN